MQKLFKRFAGWVTRWNLNKKIDDFFAARLGLTLYYFVTAIIILGGSSIITYNAILSNFTASILEREFDPNISVAIINDARGILLDRFITIDSIIILLTVVIGFLLTMKTLKPIKISMEKQKRFIADASHELRTPTAVIISGLEVALSNKKLDFPQAKKTLENTLEEMREFSKLSNTLLDISRYDTNVRIEYNPINININKLVRATIEKTKHLASIKGVNFEIKMMDNPIIVEGNEVELRRVLYNVLDNAIKYSAPEGNKIISISDKIILNKYCVTIRDNGIGIPKKIIAKVFDPFFRGDVSRSADGAGLGLTMVKKIIENHKGTIALESEEDKGTSVTITLPIIS